MLVRYADKIDIFRMVQSRVENGTVFEILPRHRSVNGLSPRLGLYKPKDKRKQKQYIPKPYERMRYPGQRIQIDVKVVPQKCIAHEAGDLWLYQFTAIDEYSRLRFLGAYNGQSA